MAVVFNFLIAVNLIRFTWGCPQYGHEEASAAIGPHSLKKAAYKASPQQIQDMPLAQITLASIKTKLKEAGIIDPEDYTLSEREKKELGKVFDAVELMMTSRSRQPSNVQSMFSSLRLVERVVKKQLKEGQISDSLVAKFHWENLPTRTRREQPAYHLDTNTNMRIFNLA